MSYKRTLHHWLTRLRAVPVWTFLALAVFFFVVHAFSLRANNQNMIELRQAVFTADEQNGDVESALRNLREYVYGHMNTDLAAGENAIRPPIQLKYRYERLVEAEQAKLKKISNQDLYSAAQDYCEQRIPTGFSGSNRLPCIREYLDSHGAEVAEEAVIPEDLYKFDFASPTWSPDLAGWSLVAACFSLFLFVLHLSSEQIIKRQLKNH